MAEVEVTQRRRISEARIEQLSWPERMDVRAIEQLRPLLQSRWARRIGQVGQLGNEPPLLLLSASLFVGGLAVGRPSLRRAAVRMMVAHLITIGLKEWGKNRVDRSRPDEQLAEGSYHLALGRSRDSALRSFPSGHTAGAVAVARAFGRDVSRYAGASRAAAGLIGALQVVRRAHYPGDVIAGALLGAVAEQLATLLIEGIVAVSRNHSGVGKLVGPAGLEPAT